MGPLPLRCRALPLLVCALLAACAADDQPPLSASVRKSAPIVTAVPKPTARAALPKAQVTSAIGTEHAVANVIYFDSDRYRVSDEYKALLKAHAKRLLADPTLHLRIDGHADGIGPADYNLELARMRAQMVKRELMELGVPAGQLQVVGHGDGKPAAPGQDAQALAANRRVELSYR